MASTNHTEPWAQMDGRGRSHPSVPRKPWAPAGQTGPLTPECPHSPGPQLDGRGRSHPSVHAAR